MIALVAPQRAELIRHRKKITEIIKWTGVAYWFGIIAQLRKEEIIKRLTASLITAFNFIIASLIITL